MIKQELDNILNSLKIIKEAELSVGELYESCSQIWQIDKEFWLNLAKMERNHADNIQKMIRLIVDQPDQFTIGRSISPIGVKTFINIVKTNTQKVLKGQLTRNNIFAIARDIEESVIEAKHSDLLKTSNTQYLQLVQTIINETHDHKELLVKKLSEVKQL